MTEPFGSICINHISKNTPKLFYKKNYSKSIYNRATKKSDYDKNTDCRNSFSFKLHAVQKDAVLKEVFSGISTFLLFD